MYNVKDYQIVVFGLIVALGAIISTMLFTGGITKFQKLQNQTITVTGSASENVTSDLAVLNFSYKAKAQDLKSGYASMNSAKEKIDKFLKDSGIDSKDIKFGAISGYEVYKHYGNYTSNEIEFYNLSSEVDVSSNDIKKIQKISENLDTLINEGVEIGFSEIKYIVSNLDDLKIKMVGEAAKNAKMRAQSMVKSTGDKIGVINSARMGVFQIVPVNSTDVSDYGISDTTSVEKKVVAVVNATFTLK